MKLIILMSIEEYARDLRKILLDHKVPIFSETNIEGYRLDDGEIAPSWFPNTSRQGIYSNLFFSFLSASKTDEVMEAIREYNAREGDGHPLRAFMMNVEEYI